MENMNSLTCLVCGGSDFMKENGYFYCRECQTQCEDIREQVFEQQDVNHEDGDRLIGTPFSSKRRTKKERPHRKGEQFTSWEIYNFVLRGQVDELLSIGAPVTLKDTILQLWTYYLQKLEVAFTSTEERVLPKLSHKYHVEDAHLLFGLKKRKSVKHPKTSSVCADLNTSISSFTDWSSMEIKKKMRNKAKKALMEKVTETSFAESESSSVDLPSMLNTSELDDSVSVLSVSMSVSTNASFSEAKFERTEAAKKRLSLRNMENDANLSHDVVRNPYSLTRHKLLVLLYLALLHEGSNIQISDLFRWIREGHLSYFSEAAKHLPETCFLQGGFVTLFPAKFDSLSYVDFLESATNLASFLELNDWPTPDGSELAKKYVKELQLPETFSDLILRFMVLLPLSLKYQVRSEIPNYEGRVLAILIVILKMLFGLDGRTEHKISKAASQINKFLKKKDEKFPKLFVWHDWIQKITCRDAVLSKYHFPTRHMLCTETFGNPYTYINFIKHWKSSNAGLLEKYNCLGTDFLRVTHPFLINSFMSIVEKLEDPEPFSDNEIDFPQCFTPYSLYIEKVIAKSAEASEPLIVKAAMDVLLQDFSKCDVTYLLSPHLLAEQISAYGQKLKIRKRSAQKKFLKYSPDKNRGLRSRFTAKQHVAILNCSRKKTAPELIELLISGGRRKMAERELKRRTSQKKGKNCVKKVKKKSKLRKSSDTKTNSQPSAKTRKRKKQTSSSKNSKKMKFSKYFKLYVPCSKYWGFSDKVGINETEFEAGMLHKFPLSFSWLLAECARMSEMSKLTLYKEVLIIEGLCRKMSKR